MDKALRLRMAAIVEVATELSDELEAAAQEREPHLDQREHGAPAPRAGCLPPTDMRRLVRPGTAGCGYTKVTPTGAAPMQISEAAQVLEAFNQDQANERLAEGWRLLAVLPGAPHGSSSSTSVIYVLGKPAEAKPGGFAAA